MCCDVNEIIRNFSNREILIKAWRHVSLCLQVLRLLKTSIPQQSAKTPIQEWGYDYLLRQRALKRPISPHLSVYKPQVTWMVSGFHRLTGCAMGGTLLIGGIGFALLPLNFTTFIDFIRGLGLPWVVTDTFKFIIAYPIAFHALNGIRFIAFDLAMGTDIASVYASGYAVLSLAALIALAVVIAPRLKKEDHVVVDMPKKFLDMLISDSIASKYDKYDGHSKGWLGCQNDTYCIQKNLGWGSELPEAGIDDFLADYIQYRIRIHGNYKTPNLVHPCRQGSENDLIRSVALIFEKNHKEELRKMVEALCENESFSLDRYLEMMEHFVCIRNETPSQMSYGRLIALIAFAGLIATRLSDMNCFAEVSMVMSDTSKFLQKLITSTWPHHKRSWSKFFDLVRTIIKLNEKEEAEPKIEKNEWWSAISRMAVNHICIDLRIFITRFWSSHISRLCVHFVFINRIITTKSIFEEMNVSDASRNDQCSGDATNESVNSLKGANIIQSYVIDYIRYRVHLENGDCPCLPDIPGSDDYRFQLIRAVALIFERKHAEELMDMATTLCLRGRLTFQRYIKVTESFAKNEDDDGRHGQLSYGRLIALISFAGLVAMKLSEMHLFPDISMIASYTAKFLHKEIVLTWPGSKRSWEDFFDRAKMIIDRNEIGTNEQLNLKSECNRWWLSIRALVIFGMFGIGAFTLMKTILKAR
uniref:Succinate dehydrogenase cytochrome b560 subunit, mitochondrial n=1 Tax=Elaeophora elaphi TaxID=1147741 RepID=A0A0R3S0K5_9BILA